MIRRHRTVMRGCFRFAVIWALPIPSAISKMHIREGIVELVCFELFISVSFEKKNPFQILSHRILFLALGSKFSDLLHAAI